MDLQAPCAWPHSADVSSPFSLTRSCINLTLPTSKQVATTWVVDTLHTAFISHTVYYYTVTRFGDYRSLQEMPVFTFNVEIGHVSLLALIVQLYFAHRSWSIDRKSWPIALAIGAFALVQFGFGVGE